MSQHIDAKPSRSEVSALNSKITVITTMSTSAGTFSTLAGLATILNTAVSSMNTYEIKRIRVDCSATVYPFTNGYSYDVELYKFNGDTYIHANFYAGGKLPIYVGVKDGSGWSFDELALSSRITWNSAGSCAPGGSINKPSVWNELLLLFTAGDDSVVYTQNIPRTTFTGNPYFRNGFYDSASQNGSVTAQWGSSAIYFISLKKNGTNDDNATMTMYYR